MVSYIACSKKTMVFSLNSKDLIELGQSNYKIKDKIDIALLRIKNNLVDKLDYFTFPQEIFGEKFGKIYSQRSSLIKIKLPQEKRYYVENIHSLCQKSEIRKSLNSLDPRCTSTN